MNLPSESARPLAVDSGEDTLIVALANAPTPSTLRLPELSEPLVTLMAVSAYDGAASTAAMTDNAAAATTQIPTRSRCLLVIVALMPVLFSLSSEVPASREKFQRIVTSLGGDRL